MGLLVAPSHKCLPKLNVVGSRQLQHGTTFCPRLNEKLKCKYILLASGDSVSISPHYEGKEK